MDQPFVIDRETEKWYGSEMAPKKTTLVMFGYDDGSVEIATGDHAEEVMQWLSSCQAMQHIHGGRYTGRKMIELPADPEPVPASLSPFSLSAQAPVLHTG